MLTQLVEQSWFWVWLTWCKNYPNWLKDCFAEVIDISLAPRFVYIDLTVVRYGWKNCCRSQQVPNRMCSTESRQMTLKRGLGYWKPNRHQNAAFNFNKKAQLSLTNPRDVKACQNCSNSTCLKRCRWQYWPIFMRLTAIASEIREIPRNSLKIQTYGVQGHPRSSILVSIESPYVTCY